MPMISMKVPDDVLARIDAEAEARNMSRTALLLLPFKIGLHVERPLAKIERGPSGENLREMYRALPAFVAPSHAETCKCLMCKPPKTP